MRETGSHIEHTSIPPPCNEGNGSTARGGWSCVSVTIDFITSILRHQYQSAVP